MKKFITLALVLVMALSLAAPAMAFTSVEYDADADTPIELSAKIVDVAEGYVSVNFTAAPTNRGYVKNEVVCMVVTMYVPKDVDPSDDFGKLVFSGTNVSVWQDENFMPGRNVGGALTNPPTSVGGGWGMLNYMSKNAYNALGGSTARPFQYAEDMSADNEIILNSAGLADLEPSSNQTYHFAIFGKVLADGAYMNAKLAGTDGLRNVSFASNGDLLWNWRSVGNDYTVGYYNPNVKAYNSSDKPDYEPTGEVEWLKDYLKSKTEVAYVVRDTTAKNDYQFIVITDKNYKCVRMYLFDSNVTGLDEGNEPADVVTSKGYGYEIYWARNGQSLKYLDGKFQIADMNTTNQNILVPSAAADANIYRRLTDLLEDVVYDEFKLDPTITGSMKPAWWVTNAEVFVEVAIEPWYAEVTVPPEIQIDPPKTGDAMNILGFVLIALAGLAVVAVRKVRA